MMIPLDSLLNIDSRFGQNYNFVFLASFFSIVAFHLVFVVALQITLIPHMSFYCSHFEWPEIADVSWPPWDLIRFWSSSVDFPYFAYIPIEWNRPNLGFPGIFLRTQGRNCLKFAMLVYSDHRQIRLDFGQGLLIFLILAPCWFSETGQIWGYWDFR